ncbi:Cytochrome C and Quinol oxidase polypeptide I [Salinibacillus kushneri]|uniref:Cytochrome C and Quinol oxidase polypeptide I n=1 Tax=Salinibacillus kushneri TaxID=237682 RepID=A0A1I0DK45_9BACI|nr:Cytochrome C and Quinol oxidase polypeptide I [Salinibacillus kushneri]
MGTLLIKISTVYFVIGFSIGYYMSTSHQYTLTGVHVHINLLGWTALTLIGIIYVLFPHLTERVYAKIHFWLHNVGLPIMMISLAVMLQTGNMNSIPLITSSAVGGTLVLIGVVFFAFNIIVNLNDKA